MNAIVVTVSVYIPKSVVWCFFSMTVSLEFTEEWAQKVYQGNFRNDHIHVSMIVNMAELLPK